MPLLFVLWIAVGVVAVELGIWDLQRRFPNSRHDYSFLYVTAILGPLNLIAVFIVLFSGLNPRAPQDDHR